jgi:uncharacterized membrane protein YphA (DoxX/SURF4 family)
LRVLTSSLLFYSVITHLGHAISPISMALQIIGAGAGILLLVGLWTPLVGALVTVFEIGIASFFAANPLVHVVVATLGAILAMIGPGAWSVDARLFGRKQIELPEK